ncbi:carboxymuconolactone decarboxylase family protein [Cohnella ginsengisoli]|uniref:carboxymuconolactone decarboxylase family protein n=1 Tax=Cohnella ginsengisoli TaxID=425004 RepID=UPI003B8A77EF
MFPLLTAALGTCIVYRWLGISTYRGSKGGAAQMNYYDRSNLKKIPDLIRLAPEAAQSYFTFEHQVYEELKTIPLRTKELIALAVAHITGCPYCIDTHVKKVSVPWRNT